MTYCEPEPDHKLETFFLKPHKRMNINLKIEGNKAYIQ